MRKHVSVSLLRHKSKTLAFTAFASSSLSLSKTGTFLFMAAESMETLPRPENAELESLVQRWKGQDEKMVQVIW